MGWEYHKRERDKRGRFSTVGKTKQLHVRMTDQDLNSLYKAAQALRTDMTELVNESIRLYLMTVDGYKDCVPSVEPEKCSTFDSAEKCSTFTTDPFPS